MMKYSEYRKKLIDATEEDEAWDVCSEAEFDPEISNDQQEKLYDLYHKKWDLDEVDEDFELANFCHGGDLLED